MLILLAGCAGIGGNADEGRNTVAPALEGTPTSSPSPTPTPPYPPGVFADRVDAFELANVNERLLSGRNSTVSYARTVRFPNGTLVSAFRFRAETAGDAFLIRLTGRVNVPLRSRFGRGNRTIWTNGTVVVVKQVSSDGTVGYRGERRRPRGGFAPLTSGRTGVYAALVGQNLSVARTIERRNETVYVLRGTVERRIATFAGSPRNGTITARVTEQGVVQSIRATYRTTLEGRSVIVTARYRTVRLDGTRVERPAWVHRALNNSDPVYPGEFTRLSRGHFADTDDRTDREA